MIVYIHKQSYRSPAAARPSSTPTLSRTTAMARSWPTTAIEHDNNDNNDNDDHNDNHTTTTTTNNINNNILLLLLIIITLIILIMIRIMIMIILMIITMILTMIIINMKITLANYGHRTIQEDTPPRHQIKVWWRYRD